MVRIIYQPTKEKKSNEEKAAESERLKEAGEAIAEAVEKAKQKRRERKARQAYEKMKSVPGPYGPV